MIVEQFFISRGSYCLLYQTPFERDKEFFAAFKCPFNEDKIFVTKLRRQFSTVGEQ